MASGGKRGGTRERVLEGRHVIGLFMLMLLFSGLFFTLGYVMGRDQYDGQVRAATNLHGSPVHDILPKSEIAPKPSNRKSSSEPQTDSTPASNPDWEFYHAGDSNKTDDRLKKTASPAEMPEVGKNGSPSRQSNAPSRAGAGTPLSASGGINLQVAAMSREADAMALANSLRKKNFPTFVQSPHGDKYYHVLVGPYAEQKAVDNARKGLELAGFKAIVKR